jgi:hypothetical protein|tara:strand:+ start:878 stop:1717 length:840 start_codon:yes stop_codon:yes gene_type:complete
MKVLKLSHVVDNYTRYSYKTNYDVWDSCIQGKDMYLHQAEKEIQEGHLNLDCFDVIFMAPIIRMKMFPSVLNAVKRSKAKTVLFDNDSCYHRFSEGVYSDIDLILYRDVDYEGNKPNTDSMWLPWHVDVNYYKPNFGGSGVAFNCTVNNHYPLRVRIDREVQKATYLTGDNYRDVMSKAGGVIHTDSPRVPQVRSKALEIASCGSQIISNRTSKMDYFFPDELITYFDSIDELKDIVSSFEPDIKIQKELRSIVEKHHSVEVRSKQVREKIEAMLDEKK